MLPVVVEEQGFGTTLAFVVATARADRIDVAPIILGLRMDGRIAVDLARRGLEDLDLQPFCQPEHVDGAVNGSLGRLNRIVLVMDRRCRAGEIIDLVNLDEERKGHVVADQLEARIA